MSCKTLLGLEVGKSPRVVGTISSYETLKGYWIPEKTPCDIVEVRLDEFESRQNDWVKRSADIEKTNIPVVLTLRSNDEGGNWNGPENERRDLLASALDVLATIDVEWSSEIKTDLCAQSKSLQKPIIVSHHDFSKTPELSCLKDIVEGILGMDADIIPKISTFVNAEKDIEILRDLLEAFAGRDPLCVIGMGALGTKTRLSFPLLGSALTYGFLDSASAPGQLSAQTLFENLRLFDSTYNADVIDRKKILEFV